ncbi:MAG: hypothetical protein IIC29_08000 [Chloroflexi bacterium]|nr:hypothetical protein [Chloroflexota bacterium]
MYDHIGPCGMPGLEMTSIAAEQGAAPPVEIVGELLAEKLAGALGVRLENAATTRSSA